MGTVIDALCFIGKGRYLSLTPEELLRKMDRAGIDRSVICPVHEAVSVYNREGNDEILRAVKQFPERLIGFASANPWYGLKAVEEVNRALSEGMKGLYFNSALQGFFIHDEIVYPLIEAAAQANVPVYFHTATPIFALPFQLAELARAFPQVNFIMGHLAAADFWTDVVPAASLAENIFVETSLRSGVATIKLAIRKLGAERVLFGSSTPESEPYLELEKIHMVRLSPQEEELVLGKNMERLLTLKPQDQPTGRLE